MEDKEKLREFLNLENNDIVFITSGKYEEVKTSLGFLRKHLAHEHDLINKDIYKFLWVTEFPMYEYDKEETGKGVWVAPGDFEFIMQIDKPANWENTLRRI